MNRPGRLSVRWSKAKKHGVSRLNGERGDVLYEWGDGTDSADHHLVHYCLSSPRMKVNLDRQPGDLPWTFDERSFIEELHHRGYDLTTLRFSIDKRPVAPSRTEKPHD